MSESRITRVSVTKLKRGRTDTARLRKMTDDDIASAVAGDPEAAPIDIDWSDAELVIPGKKTSISIRLDADILDFFKQSGPSYQTRINAVLRHYMNHEKRKQTT